MMHTPRSVSGAELSPEDRAAAMNLAGLMSRAINERGDPSLVSICDRFAVALLALVDRKAKPDAVRQSVPVLRSVERTALTHAIRVMEDSGRPGDSWALRQLLERSVL